MNIQPSSAAAPICHKEICGAMAGIRRRIDRIANVIQRLKSVLTSGRPSGRPLLYSWWGWPQPGCWFPAGACCEAGHISRL
jgi:hypothetical protein